MTCHFVFSDGATGFVAQHFFLVHPRFFHTIHSPLSLSPFCLFFVKTPSSPAPSPKVILISVWKLYSPCSEVVCAREPPLPCPHSSPTSNERVLSAVISASVQPCARRKSRESICHSHIINDITWAHRWTITTGCEGLRREYVKEQAEEGTAACSKQCKKKRPDIGNEIWKLKEKNFALCCPLSDERNVPNSELWLVTTGDSSLPSKSQRNHSKRIQIGWIGGQTGKLSGKDALLLFKIADMSDNSCNRKAKAWMLTQHAPAERSEVQKAAEWTENKR